jgi:ABC-type Fe3+-hydroxamate transport system substrate-binding protein
MTSIRPREFIWFAPFVCIGLMSLGLLLPLPHFPVPVSNRTIVDAGGTKVQVALPLRGVALTWGFEFPQWYLEDTHAPGTLIRTGDLQQRGWFGKNTLSWIYPQVLRQNSLWDASRLSYGHGPNGEIETLFAYSPGVYLGAPNGLGPLLRRVGLPVIYPWGLEKSFEDSGFKAARINTLLVGHPERAEGYIDRYRQVFVDLQRELQPSTLAYRPRVLLMASSISDKTRIGVMGKGGDYQTRHFPRAGVVNGALEFLARRQDAERILAMDPDIVFLTGVPDPPWRWESPSEFMSDPRWRGLKAVHEKRVYRLPGALQWGPGGLLFKPVEIRWLAEIAHPDRLRSNVRQLLRDRVLAEFGYRMSDSQIDSQLQVPENSGSAGYERFTRDYPATNKQGPSK